MLRAPIFWKDCPLDAIVAARVPRAAAFALAAALFVFASPGRAQSPLPVVQVKVAGHALRVEVASTVEQRMKGLMFREKMGRNDGMLFVFEDPGYHAMWMKNTPLALSVAFVDGEGRILNITDMEPQTLDQHFAAGPARYAIETHKGWFAERRIKPGDKVAGLPRPR
jgi:uncharacterized membrane protein (UPF0127 family)